MTLTLKMPVQKRGICKYFKSKADQIKKCKVDCYLRLFCVSKNAMSMTQLGGDKQIVEMS